MANQQQSSKPAPEPKAEEPVQPKLFVVTEAFVTQEHGALGVYKKGKIVEAGDKYLKAMPGRFAPYDPLHPPKQARRGILSAPEIRG